jgi:hypothetical protein
VSILGPRMLRAEPGEDIHTDRGYRQHLVRVLTEPTLQHQAG